MDKEKFLNLEYQETKLNRFLDSLKDSDRHNVFSALELAKRKHNSQFRDSAVPYIIHPIRTALILPEELGIQDIDMLCAALLHDAIEDGEGGSDEIERVFGAEVGRIVRKVTRVRSDNESEEQKAIAKIEKLKEIAEQDERVRLIKLCDVLDNMRSMEFIPEISPSRDKITRWKRELKDYVLPIAKKTDQRLFEKLEQFID
ncbi:MAG: HD domain-containing protein [Patescibacteria group bacterium]|nr:HD domain-containing protein [Patescibacteria group bacterium]